jgi:hypothetical protein
MDWEAPNCGCGHRWEDHNRTVGCFHGWEYTGNDPGSASKEGCECLLAHVERSTDDLR